MSTVKQLEQKYGGSWVLSSIRRQTKWRNNQGRIAILQFGTLKVLPAAR